MSHSKKDGENYKLVQARFEPEVVYWIDKNAEAEDQSRSAWMRRILVTQRKVIEKMKLPPSTLRPDSDKMLVQVWLEPETVQWVDEMAGDQKQSRSAWIRRFFVTQRQAIDKMKLPELGR